MHPVRIGPYLIDRKIGSGAMGAVYVGRRDESQEVAAIKVLNSPLSRDEGFILRFNREIDVLESLNQPNIVQFYERGIDIDGTTYYAMEYIDGENLSNRLRRDRRIPWRDAIELGIQICAGLKHAHDVGVIHRDLKPSNLLISTDGIVKITDFGVAQVFASQQLTTPGAIIGTAEFMSPEQVEGRRVDRRSDLYSLGAVLYSMVVGQPPFYQGSPQEIMQKQRFGVFDPPRRYVPDVPSWLDEIICQLMEKNPDKRFPDAHVVARRLQEVIKKVEMNSSIPVVNPADPNAETHFDKPVGSPHSVSPTLVRELFKVQVEQKTNSITERLLNNTWVLVSLLTLLLVGIYMLWPHDDRVASASASNSGPGSEPDRILGNARWLWKTGEGAKAKQKLESLRVIIAHDPKYDRTVKAIDKLLEQIRNARPTYQQAFINAALDRAASVQNDDPELARAILEGVIDLYGNDRFVSDLVDKVRKQLDVLRSNSKAPSPRVNPSNKSEVIPDPDLPLPTETEEPASN